tara:strand:+ start:2989 stop:3441 length:453 start_codon:yes stop_codon:yes gene_type:complete
MSDTASEYGLCTQPDYFIEDKPIWYVHLSDGLTVYQDDNRPGQHEPCAWRRLWQYCKDKNVSIQSMSIRFRSNIVHIPNQDNAEGYYFSYGAIKEITDIKTRSYYICGTLRNNKINSSWYATPELLEAQKNQRNFSESDIQDKRLILNSP